MASTAFDEAQQQSDKAKAAALEALARGGSTALEAYKQAQEQQAAMKKASAEAALRRATDIGATAAGEELAAGGHLAGTAEAAGGRSASAIYDTYATDQARAGAARTQALADMAGANAQYFSQVDAARPIVEGRAKAAWDAKEAARILAEQRAQQAELDRIANAEWREQQRAWTVEDRDYKIQDRAATRAEKAARAASGNDLSDAELAVRLQGASAARAAMAPHKPPKSIMGFAIPQMSQTQRARNIGVEAGLDPARVYGVTQPKAVKAPAKAPSPSQAAYRADVTRRVLQHASPATADLFVAFVGGKPETEEYYAVPPVKSFAEAMRELRTFSDAELRSEGVSRDVLTRWLSDYFSV